MDWTEYVDTRRKRHLAQTLKHFDSQVAPRLDLKDPVLREAVLRFKETVRSELKIFADDMSDLMAQAGVTVQVNAAAVHIRDRLDTR